MKSKSRKRKETIDCIACQVRTDLFVAILKNNSGGTMQKHWFVCLNCYEEDRWQIVTNPKELTMKSGLSFGSTKSKRRSKRSASPSAEAWEESNRATSTSNSRDESW